MKFDNRKNIYYWKSDRPYALGNVQDHNSADLIEMEKLLRIYLTEYFQQGVFELKLGDGQGDHVTYMAIYPHQTYFVRIDNGPENDNYIDVESAVLQCINELGIPSPKLFHCDSSRTKFPFAIQIIEYINSKDLNALEKNGELNILTIAESIGRFVAKWQSIRPSKYGLFDRAVLMEHNRLEGYHDTYRDYFLLNWDVHLRYLQTNIFFEEDEVSEIRELVRQHDYLLDIPHGCLVHKDLALWNILGSSDEIVAFIDWSDTISGDAMDDLSLLGCFHSGEVVQAAIKGYACVKTLPENWEKRFWLHLLRNIIFKAVIRVRGDYFNKPESFFMSNANSSDLRAFTLQRIRYACEGLRGNMKIQDL